VCLREARVNAVTRIGFETSLANELKFFPKDTTFLMYTADHVGALQRAGIPLKHVVTENNWGYWQRALQAPAQSVNIVISIGDDPVSAAVARHPDDLQELEVLHTTGQPVARIYQSHAKTKSMQ
jgi:hypothetical protein